MTTDLVPLAPQPVTDISRFENFAVPSRKLTSHEKAIYRRLASDWAQLDASAQSTLYASYLTGKLTEFLGSIFSGLINTTLDQQDASVDPRGRSMLQNFHNAMLQQDGQILLGFKLTAARKMDAVLAEDYPDTPPTPNVWQRMLGRGT